MEDRKGFTLIEMIVVIILIALIAVVAIPNAVKLLNSQSNDRYDVHQRLIKQALDLYTIRYKGDFDNSPNIKKYRLSYNKLINEELLTEDLVLCNGFIDLEKKNNNTYAYTYYLTCHDSKSDKRYVDNNKNLPACNESTNCILISN